MRTTVSLDDDVMSAARSERVHVRRALLDVNVLLARLDSDHVDHVSTRDWFRAEVTSGWACSRQVTDVYLLAVATAHDSRLVTFNRSIPLAAVLHADPANLVVLR